MGYLRSTLLLVSVTCGALLGGCLPVAQSPVEEVVVVVRRSEIFPLAVPFESFAAAVRERAPALDARVRAVDAERLVLIVRTGGAPATVTARPGPGTVRVKVIQSGDSLSPAAFRVRRVLRFLEGAAAPPAPPPVAPGPPLVAPPAGITPAPSGTVPSPS